jgi:hypothetical protein
MSTDKDPVLRQICTLYTITNIHILKTCHYKFNTIQIKSTPEADLRSQTGQTTQVKLRM